MIKLLCYLSQQCCSTGRLFLLAGAFYGMTPVANAQQFTDVTPVPLSDVNARSVQWMDYEGDGDLDVVSVSSIYLNNGNGSFTLLNTLGLTADFSKATWGDYDRDGDLDVLLVGTEYEYDANTGLYNNNGNGNFTHVSSGLIPLEGGSAAWGDYDNDGDLDIVMTGVYSRYYAPFVGPDLKHVTKIYTNNNNVFTELSSTGLRQHEAGPITWGDYDSDGDLDLLFSGTGNLYTNNGNDTFSLLASSGFSAGGSGAWGDYDNDGDLDVIVNNDVYTNLGDGIFSPVNQFDLPDASWGDYDNDGDLDVLGTSVYINNGNGNFTQLATTGITESGITRWGDYDNDGDLDVLVAYSWENLARVFRNNSTVKNTPPSPPTALTATVNGSSVLLNWQPATDAQTPAPAMTYNLYIGTTPGGIQKMAPDALIPTGFRRVVALGNGQNGTNFQLNDLPSGTYYWSVQAVDQGFAGSGFAAENSFTVVAPAPVITGFYPAKGAPTTSVLITGSHFNGVTAVRFNGLDAASFERLSAEKIRAVVPDGATTGNISVTASGGTTTSTTPFKVTPLPFVHVPSANVQGSTNGEWGDYDNDNDLDIVVTGSITYGGDSPTTKLYTNRGNGIFSEVTTAALPGVYDGTTDWVDYDNDGDLDLFLTGCIEQGCYTSASRIYSNLGNGYFGEVSTSNFHPAAHSATAWGDYDNDGDLDLYLMGDAGAFTGIFSSLYENQGDGTFINSRFGSPGGGNYGSADWGDYDNDGDLDLLISGNTNEENYSPAIGITEVYTNNGNGSFSRLTSINLPGVFGGSTRWGDYDNDGYPDILLTGYPSFYEYYYSEKTVSRVYTNNRNGGFEELTTANLPSTAGGVARWGDYDNDHDLDILMTGAGIFKNQNPAANTPPTAPTGLSAAVNNNKVVLTWNAATDAETPSPGLSYNLYVGTSPEEAQEVSPQANTTNGYRRIVRMGDVRQGTSFTVKDLPADTYYWSVQAIDHTFEGSPFAPGGSFQVTSNVPYNLGTIDVSNTTAFLKWSFDEPAESFFVRYRLQGSSKWIGRSSNTPTMKLVNLQPDRVYEWQVKAIERKNPLKESGFSPISTFKTDLYQECKPPINPVVSAVSPTSATVSWSSYLAGVEYEIFYNIVGSGATPFQWETVKTRGLQKTLTGLASGQTYEVMIRANCDEFFSSHFSQVARFSTPGNCAMPDSMNTTLTGSNSVVLSWEVAPGASGYTVLVKAQNSSNWITRSSATNTLTINNLIPQTVYEWKVRSTCGSNMLSAFTPMQEFTTSGQAAARPEAAETQHELVLYPNPSESTVNIELHLLQKHADAHLYIYDVAGSLVYSRTMHGELPGKVQVNLKNKGLYIARVSSEGSTWVKKFVIQ